MKIKILLLFLYFPILLFSQSKKTISGFVTDAHTGESLIGASVFDLSLTKGITTNEYGFYSITIETGNRILQSSYVGYNSESRKLILQNDTVINFSLGSSLLLKEVDIVRHRSEVSNPELSGLTKQQLNLPFLNSMPVILGERDLLKTIQYLPGIKSGKENTTNFNVRGGDGDQNLILLDGVPVYNVSHLMGFFSIFNNDAIKHASLYKGGIPARYGGRLSSVLDVAMKEGNLKRDGGVFSISPISARISFESPIKIDTSAFIVSYRRSFIDLPMRLIQAMNGEDFKYGYFFHDFNGKANWKLNENNRIYLSFYFGKDKSYSRRDDKLGENKWEYYWGNLTSVFRWNKIFTNNLFANFSAYYSQFNHTQKSEYKTNGIDSRYNTNSNLKDLSLSSDFDYFPFSNYSIKFGAKISLFEFSPNISQVRNSNIEILPEVSIDRQSINSAIYIENIFQTGKFDFNIGSRFSCYNVNKKTYLSLQPRASLKYNAEKFSTSATYTEMDQFMHLLSNSGMGMPTDLWVASTEKIGPQKARQISLGISSMKYKKLSFDLEGYYKWMFDVIQLKEGTMFTNTNNYTWDDYVVTGRGRAYGLEFMTQKTEGKYTGIFSYTLSWSERKFAEINASRWFPFKYDRRHDFSFLAEYHFPEKYLRKKSISIAFTLQSGNNLSIPDTKHKGFVPEGLEGGSSVEKWKERQTFNEPNNFKMPTFHHLDIGYNIEQKRYKRNSITWSFSIYNVYNRMNPWYYYDEGEKVKQFSMFPFIPSVSFTYRW
ncbi:MAG: TonB-dependent receptor [Bacteroidota bacterium]|nr:TonB-dependent receptor [Bacteroidota bacterium]